MEKRRAKTSVIHLAAIVGDPLCKKIPQSARQINEFATKNLVTLSKKQNVKRFVFASTCSNYGSSLETVDESSQIQPLSLYSECKVNSEKFILEPGIRINMYNNNDEKGMNNKDEEGK